MCVNAVLKYVICIVFVYMALDLIQFETVNDSFCFHLQCCESTIRYLTYMSLLGIAHRNDITIIITLQRAIKN